MAVGRCASFRSSLRNSQAESDGVVVCRSSAWNNHVCILLGALGWRAASLHTRREEALQLKCNCTEHFSLSKRRRPCGLEGSREEVLQLKCNCTGVHLAVQLAHNSGKLPHCGVEAHQSRQPDTLCRYDMRTDQLGGEEGSSHIWRVLSSNVIVFVSRFLGGERD